MKKAPTLEERRARGEVWTRPVIMADYQIDHLERLLDILQDNIAAANLSPPGRGKTPTALKVSEEMGLAIFGIVPAGLIPHWERETAKYGTPVYDIVSYDTLRSSEGRSGTAYVERRDRYTEGNIHKVDYIPTKELLKIIDAGALFVIDECHKVKNNSDQFAVVAAIAKAIYLRGGTSRILLLTGTIIAKHKKVLRNYLRIMGIMRHVRAFTTGPGGLQLEGIQDIVDFCNVYDEPLTSALVNEIGISKKSIDHLIFRLFVDVIKPAVCVKADVPDYGNTMTMTNAFYRVSEEDRRNMGTALDRFALATGYDPATKRNIIRTVNGMGAERVMRAAYQDLEIAKIGVTARVVKERMVEKPENRQIIFAFYKPTIALLKESFPGKRVKVIWGKTDIKKKGRGTNETREDIRLEFQAGEVDVLICNYATCSLGIDLNDIIGNHPHDFWFLPTYNFTDLIQATYRGQRHGVKSDVTVTVVYIQGLEREMDMLHALTLSSENLREINGADVIRFPGEYDTYTEAAPAA